MKTINLYFQVHQPYRLKRYRFFNIGKDHYYLDEPANRTILQRVAERCYLPMNRLLLQLIRENEGRFKVSFSLSGSVLEQFRMYAPPVVDSFRELARTGCVEFLGETYAHSLSSLSNTDEFLTQIRDHSELIACEFGQRPRAFRNTELIYSDALGRLVSEAGFEVMLTEGAKQLLGWRSPNFLYSNAVNPNLKLLLRNYPLSDALAFRFSDRSWNEWPLTVEKYVKWLGAPEMAGELINLFLDYETFGEHQRAETGIFEFFKRLPQVALDTGVLSFGTPSESGAALQSQGLLSAPSPISWADEERDVTAWMGNELQDAAFQNLYAQREKVLMLNDLDLNNVWRFLQGSDHFYYMATKWFSDGDIHHYFNPYATPYDAFVNYMNVLSDFSRELDLRLARCEGLVPRLSAVV